MAYGCYMALRCLTQNTLMPSPSDDGEPLEKKAGTLSYITTATKRRRTTKGGIWGYLLLRGVVDEADALLDVALEALDRGVQE